MVETLVTKKNYKQLLKGNNYFYYKWYPYGKDTTPYEEIVNVSLDGDGKFVYLFGPGNSHPIKGLDPYGIWTKIKSKGIFNPIFYITSEGEDYNLYAAVKKVCGQCGSSPGAVCGYCRY